MKAIINNYLNARVEEASTHATCNFYRSPGDVLAVDDAVVGEEIDGNAVWYHSPDDGCYYWSGGASEPDGVIKDAAAFPDAEQLHLYRNAVNAFSADMAAAVPGFKGLAAGFKETDGIRQRQLSLIVYVDTKMPDGADNKVPAYVVYKGIRLLTDVRAVGKCSLQDGDVFTDTQEPFNMGGSLSPVDADGKESEFGTRTALVQYRKKTYLLTCFHVACSALYKSGTTSYDGSAIAVNIPSRASGSALDIIPGKVARGAIGSYYDYALIDTDPKFFSNTVDSGDFAGYYQLSELQDAYLKTISFNKFGARNPHPRTGSFKAYHSDAVKVDDQTGLVMSGVMEIDKISDGGDSGAPVVDASNKLIGFIVAGTEASTYLIPFAVLNSFEIDLLK